MIMIFVFADKAKVDEEDDEQGATLVELSTADMSNPTLARIDCFVIARCPQRNCGSPTDFYFLHENSKLQDRSKLPLIQLVVSFIRGSVIW